MIALVEGASRQKTPNEIALNILLAGLTIIFLLAAVTLQPFAIYSERRAVDHRARRAAGLPHPDDDRRPAVGHRHRRHGPAGAAQRAGHVRAGGRGGRRRARRCCSTRPARSPTATARPPSSSRSPAVDEQELAEAALLSSLADETPEGRSIVTLAEERYGLSPPDIARRRARPVHRPDPHERHRLGRRAGSIRKGAADSVRRWVAGAGRHRPRRPRRRSSSGISTSGGTPLVVADGRHDPRRHPPQGHREAGHERALRRAARDGHPHGHDHRRQPAHGGGHRRGGRRRRLPRRGHARGQDGAASRRSRPAATSSP